MNLRLHPCSVAPAETRRAGQTAPPAEGLSCNNAVLAARHRTRLAAYAAHPERFVHGPPRPETMPTAVWINRPPTLTSQVAPATTTVTPVDPQPGSMRPTPRIDNRPGTLVTSVESLQ